MKLDITPANNLDITPTGPGLYESMDPEKAVERSNAIHDRAVNSNVSFDESSQASLDVEQFSVHQMLTKPAPDHVPLRMYGMGGSVPVGKSGPRTRDETIQYNYERLPKDARIKAMADDYRLNRKAEQEAEAEKTVNIDDVLSTEMYLSYFTGVSAEETGTYNPFVLAKSILSTALFGPKEGVEEEVMAIGEANIYVNKPSAFGVNSYDSYFSDNPDEIWIPSLFNARLDNDRVDEVDMLAGMEIQERKEYYNSKGGEVGVKEWYKEKDKREFMLFNDILGVAKSKEMKGAIDRLRSPETSYQKSDMTDHGYSPRYSKDTLLVRDHLFALEEAQERGMTGTAFTAELGSSMVTYMGELILLGGLGGAAKVGKGYKALRGLGASKLVARNSVKFGVATSRMLLRPDTVGKLTLDRMTGKAVSGDYGKIIHTAEGQSLIKALPKSMAEQTVRNFIELKGDDLVRGLTKVGGKVVQKLPRGLVGKLDDVADYMRKTGVKSMDKLPKGMQASLKEIRNFIGKVNKAGNFNGVFGENLEEYTEQIVMPALRLDDQYRDADNTYLENVVDSFKIDKEQVMYQSIVFSLLPFATGGIAGVGKGVQWAGKTVTDKQPTLPQVKNRIDLENSIANEYGFDRKQSYEIADMLDNGTTVNRLEERIHGFGGKWKSFSFDHHNNRVALTAMLQDRGLVSKEATRIAEIASNIARDEGVTVREVVAMPEFKKEVEDVLQQRVFTLGEQLEDMSLEEQAEMGIIEFTPAEDAAIQRLIDGGETREDAINAVMDSTKGLSLTEESITETEKVGEEDAGEKTTKESEPTPQEKPEPKGTEERKPRKLAKSTEQMARVNNLVEDFEVNPDYAVSNMAEHAEMAIEVIDNNYEEALLIAMGDPTAVNNAEMKGLLPEMVFVEMLNKATVEGDAVLVEQLGTQSALIKEATRMGKKIRAYGEIKKNSPLGAMQTVIKARDRAMKSDDKDAIKRAEKTAVKAEKELTKTESKLADKEIEQAVKGIVPKGKPVDTKAASYGRKNKLVSNEEYKSILAEIDAEQANIKEGKGTRKGATLSLETAVKLGVYHLEAMGRQTGQWSKVMTEQLGDWVKPHLDKIMKEASKQINQFEIELNTEKIAKKASGGTPLTEMTQLIQKLSKALIGEGYNTRTKLVNKMHNILQGIDPDITKRDTKDAISGYGKFRILSKH